MSNFEYIIASLPYLTVDYRYPEGHSWQDVIAEIRENLSDNDNATLDVLLDGFNPEKLDADFYRRALEHPSKLIREYFLYDLNLRNAKVRYINAELGRGPETDILYVLDPDMPHEFAQEKKVENALSLTSLLDREKALDQVTWDTVDAMGTFHYFDLTAVLVYVAKLHIVDRWLALDEEKGRELFRRLVKEVRGTFKGVEYKQ